MYRIHRVSHQYGFVIGLLATLLCVPAAVGQMQVGDNLFMNLNGNLGYGYTGSFGNYQTSSRSQGFATNANLNGYYFHPNFLSFNVHPYYDRASSSSESQSITRSDGISASAGIFTGSNFPASASYGLDFSNNSEFSVAGVPSLVGNSFGRHYSLTWSELLPGRPHVYANFNASNSTSTLLSTDSEGKSASKNLNINSDYRLAGFDLRGNFMHNNNSFTTPDFMTAEAVEYGGSGTTYGVTAQHKIPLGGLGLGWSHSSYDSNRGGGGSGNNFYEGAGVTLYRKLSLNQTFNYTTNTTAALTQTILNGNPVILSPDRDSTGMFFLSTANLQLGHGLSFTGNYSNRRVTFQNQEYTDSQYGGSVNFNRRNRFLGFMYASVGFIDIANKYGNAGAGLVANIGMNKKIKHWETSADFNYYQSVQTLYAISTTSSYGYGGNIHRKLNPQTFWSASFRGTHSGLTNRDGNYNQSESFNTNLSWKRYSVSGSYSQSTGLAVLSATGEIVPTPVGPLLSDYLYVFDARNWSLTGSTRLFQRLYVSGGYTSIKSDSQSGLFKTLSDGHRYYSRTEYRLRRFTIQGGFSRVEQEVNVIPGGPRITNSYYISLARWFNVF